ncbi:hypothetical protein SD457_18945 [Coprobacillaceae bacterium CR2/5/TPMF4]|nr:hypothetical protein SD457_18945 [Coprobacillaceae bacterium CR2/5/TPMF4]
MIKILFICLGNICRSPMAEFVFKDLVEKEGLSNHFLFNQPALVVKSVLLFIMEPKTNYNNIIFLLAVKSLCN